MAVQLEQCQLRLATSLPRPSALSIKIQGGQHRCRIAAGSACYQKEERKQRNNISHADLPPNPHRMGSYSGISCIFQTLPPPKAWRKNGDATKPIAIPAAAPAIP